MDNNAKWWLALVVLGSLSAMRVGGQQEIRYRLEEEQTIGTFVGNVIQDARLDRVYPAQVLPNLRFRFLKPTNSFQVSETTGDISTKTRIDRDEICPQAERCEMRVDIAIQPVDYFKIIKVMIEILDQNDNAPLFPEPQITHSMLESASPGTSFVIPTAVDSDSPEYTVQAYDLVSRTGNFKLQVDEKVDGSKEVKVVLIESLDREAESEYELKVVAYDGGSPVKSGSVDLAILVLDANDNSPTFDQALYEVTVPENVAQHTSIIQVHATDPDSGPNGQVFYGFSERTLLAHGHLFGINNITGDIMINGVIDYEESAIYHLSVIAKDRGADSIAGDATVIVRVDDVNDHAPEISVSTLTAGDSGNAEIAEDANIGTFVAHITVIDHDTAKNGQFNCSLNDNQFTLKALYDNEYQILTQTKLDREKQGEFNLALVCKDNGKVPQIAIKHIKVVVTDVNDHSPVFARMSYKAELIENSYIGASVVQVNATDMDIGNNSKIIYSIPGQAASLFNIHPVSGVITASASLDREEMDTVRFHVVASDQGSPARSSSAVVSVVIQDVNDEKPQFVDSNYSFGIFENEPQGTEVGAVSAKDRDSSPYNEFTFSILPIHGTSDYFHVDRFTGMITNNKELDRESQTTYELVIAVTDRGVPPLSSTATVTIYVADKNDNAPTFDYPTPFNNTLYLSNLAPEGYIVTTIRAHDIDTNDNAKVTFVLAEGNVDGAFKIDSEDGTLTVVKDLEHMEDKQYELEILAQDHGFPQQKSFTFLNVLLNKSVNFPLAEGQHLVLSGHNFTIVISLACASGVITVILVVAIVLIRRQDQDKRTHKYNCRMEALKMLSQKERKSSTDSACNGGLPNGSCGEGEKAKKEVSFNLEAEDGNQDKSRQSWPSVIDHQTLQNPQASSSLLTQQSPGGRGVKQSQGQGNSKPWALTQKELEVHQLLQLLKRDGDSASLHSGEGSNTDSGRGPSEEGEGSRPHADLHTDSQVQPASNGHLSLSTVHEDSLNQVVPSLPASSLPQHSFNSSAHSYSSRQPHKLHTFSQDNDKYMSRGHDKNFNNSNNTSYGVAECTALDMTADANHAFVHATPAKVIPVTPKGVAKHQRARNYGNGKIFGHNDDSGTESELSDMQYSCVDVSEVLRYKTPSRLEAIQDDDDDTATTTSGSYMVDPDDLCDHIDELFFGDMKS